MEQNHAFSPIACASERRADDDRRSACRVGVSCGPGQIELHVGRCEITRYDRQSTGLKAVPRESISRDLVTPTRRPHAARRGPRPGPPHGTALARPGDQRGPGPLWSDHGVACFRARHRRRTGARDPPRATGMESTTHKALLDVLHSFRYLRHPPPAPRGPSLGSRLYRSPGRSTCSPQRLFRSRPSLIPHTSL